MEFNSIMENLNKSCSPSDYNLKGLLNALTEDDVSVLVSHIEKRQYLSNYKQGTKLNNNACALLFSKVLPVMYSKSEIIEYFLDILVGKHDDELNWTKPRKKELFKEITGYTISHSEKRNFVPGILFNEAYDTFTKDYYYPSSFKRKTIESILKSETLIENYVEFKSKYANGDDSYLVYLDAYIIDQVGVSSFKEYLDIKFKEYADSIKGSDITTLTVDRMLSFIFGYHWSFMMHLGDFISGRRKNKPAHFRLHKMLLNAMFPYVYINYRGAKVRESVYSLLEFNQDQINYYENLASRVDRQNTTFKTVIPENHESILLPNGSTFQEIYFCVNDYFESVKSTGRTVPSKAQSLNALNKTINDSKVLKDYKYACKYPSVRAIINGYIDSKIIETKKYMHETNIEEMHSNKNSWRLYYILNGNYRSVTINFELITKSQIRRELKLFSKHAFTSNKNSYYGNSIYSCVINAMKYMIDEFNIMSSSEIQDWHILSYLHNLEVNDKKKPSTVASHLSYLRIYFDFLMNSDYKYKPKNDPTLNIKLSSINEHVKPTDVIPEDIIVFLDNHIDEMRKDDVKLIYKLLMETGWRFSDIRNIKTCDVTFNPGNDDFAVISVSSPKTKKARIAHRLGDVIEDVISLDLYFEIQDYIATTKDIREVYKIDTLFYTIVNGVPGFYSASNFNLALKKLCDKHSVKSIDENYWNISSRQTRKTVAVSLVSSGASLSAVQKKLGHVTTETTEKIYAEVHRKTIQELNNEFYKEKFDIYMDESKLKLFTEEERRILYVDFSLNRRNVELGVCSKHPSEGRCASLGYTSCAQCPKLCTGKKFLNEWEKLANDSLTLINQFVKTYENKGIPEDEYRRYIEYSQEVNLYSHYQSVINEIMKGELNERR